MSDITIVEDTFGDFIDAEQPGNVLPVRRFTLSNRAGMKVEVINYGAKIRSIIVPDKTGKLDDVALGFDDMIGYQSEADPYFGATIGRTSNRIKDGRFTLDSTAYQLGLNENNLTHLHGGFYGFDKKLWNAEIVNGTVVMSRVSLNGEEQYPGDVLANAETLEKLNWLSIQERCSVYSLEFLYKYLLNNPENQYNVQRRAESSRESRRKNDLVIPLMTTTFGQQAYFYRVSKEWNDLPNEIKECESLVSFDALIRQHLLSKRKDDFIYS